MIKQVCPEYDMIKQVCPEYDMIKQVCPEYMIKRVCPEYDSKKKRRHLFIKRTKRTEFSDILCLKIPWPSQVKRHLFKAK
jgi:hypothetical protein